MPQRAVGILLGVLGLCLVGMLLLVGVDLLVASRTGPRWKRKLLIAGLLFLGLNTSTGCQLFFSCYAPVPPPTPAEMSYDRLSSQLKLLDQMARSKKLDPKVVDKTLVAVQQDLEVLDKEEELDKLPKSERAEARIVRDLARADVQAIKARLQEPPSAADNP